MICCYRPVSEVIPFTVCRLLQPIAISPYRTVVNVPCTPFIYRKARIAKGYSTSLDIPPTILVFYQPRILSGNPAVYIVIPCTTFLYQPVFNRFRCGGRRIRLCGHHQVCCRVECVHLFVKVICQASGTIRTGCAGHAT